MKRRAALLLFLLIAADFASAGPADRKDLDRPQLALGGPLSPTEPLNTGFRMKVNAVWVPVNASVWDPQPRTSVQGLEKEDFELMEDGIPQTIRQCLSSETPLHLMLLLDVSASTSPFLNLLKDVASRFVGNLMPTDRIALTAFSSRSILLQPFTRDRKAIRRALKSIRAGSDTAFYDALLKCLQVMSDIKGRKAIVIFSDGADNRLSAPGDGSKVAFEQLRDEIRRSEAVIFSVFLMPSQAEDRHQVMARAREQMQTITAETGGKMCLASQTRELPGAFSQLIEELRHTYTLTYQPADSLLPGWRELGLRITGRPNLVVRARKGYLSSSLVTVADKRAELFP